LSLPWYQAGYLPGAILIAHEVGHLLEREFELSDFISSALARAPLRFPNSWHGWAGEIFADVYGTLAMGPAFVGALIDLLANSSISTQRHFGGSYPTSALRVELVLTTLTEIKGRSASDPLWESWQATYDRPHAMRELSVDVAKVVDAILSGLYHGLSLTEIISFDEDPQATTTIVFGATNNMPGRLEAYHEPRQLFTAARRIHETCDPKTSSRAFDLLTDHIVGHSLHQFRFRDKLLASLDEVDTELTLDEKAAREAGRHLRALLRPVAPCSS
jgi:hypothetical protein